MRAAFKNTVVLGVMRHLSLGVCVFWCVHQDADRGEGPLRHAPGRRLCLCFTEVYGAQDFDYTMKEPSIGE